MYLSTAVESCQMQQNKIAVNNQLQGEQPTSGWAHNIKHCSTIVLKTHCGML